jgi:two-component system chemotaxis sensor kinase CheA
MTTGDEFLQTLRATFKVEAAEHLQTIGTGLLALEKTTDVTERLPLIDSVFRAAHSLKGAARAVGFEDIESICQSLESLFASWKRGESAPTPNALDVAHRALDEISATTAAPAEKAPAAAPPASRSSESVAFSRPSSGGRESEPPARAGSAAASAAADAETVRISVGSLDRRLLEAEELLMAKLAANQRAAEIGTLIGQL